ncbi:peptidoglycan DD-metalloendopeptidase family protein [Moorella naiadis]|uniref:peptidoglycan DD-metalloendopeptidase family protein n=1 Tax=Moorella naiadis (nom. illeg.) TaxID=3093670 RepID=UPI003D9CA6A0
MPKNRRDRFFTLMLIPEGRRDVHRWLLPPWFFPALAAMLVALLVALSGALLGVYHYQKRVAELHHIDELNAAQARQIRQLEEQARLLQDKMQSLDRLDQQVRSLAGLGQGGGQLSSGASRSGRLRPTEQSQTLVRVQEALAEVDRDAPQQQLRLQNLARELEQHLAYQAARPSHWPVQGPVTSPFGRRDSPFGWREEFHDGIDIAATYGAEVQAAGNGRVTFAGWMPVYGQAVIIDHGYGFTSLYGHNFELLVKKGDQVVRGQAIARVGSSGRSTGPHVHFQIKLNGELVDPLNYLEEGDEVTGAGKKE